MQRLGRRRGDTHRLMYPSAEDTVGPLRLRQGARRLVTLREAGRLQHSSHLSVDGVRRDAEHAPDLGGVHRLQHQPENLALAWS